MKAICSCCGRSQGEIKPHDDERVTHVMCIYCAEYFSMLWSDKVSPSAGMESLPIPAFMLTAGRRLVACNKKAESVLNKKMDDMAGLLCGEFLGCERSHLPEGCGLTPHCESCIIRRTLAITADTGKTQERVMAFLHINRRGAPEFMNLMVTTRKAGELIELDVAGL
jgi:hypothetical protein